MWGGIFVILIFLGTVLSQYKHPRVTTQFGVLKGNWDESLRGRHIASYLGIPYAEPPTGDLRFQKPSPWTKTWRKVRDSTKYAESCLNGTGPGIGSEDCLYLNIFTPQLSQYSTRGENDTDPAVLVFLINSLVTSNDNALYEPSYLLDQDIVLVTVNYRHGYFGFFTTGDEAAPGNYGLKDVLEALDWIQRNIAAFGGDPENVTLMGQGVGASIAHLLALSEKSEGLFHKYVTQSGAAQGIWSYRPVEIAKNVSLNFAFSVNCTGSTSQEIVECMRRLPDNVSSDDNAYLILSPWHNYGPTNEPESDEAVITEHPNTLMENGNMRDIPWLTGVVADEALILSLDFLKSSTMCQALAEHFEEIVSGLTNYWERLIDPTSYVRDLAVFYYDGNISVDCADSFAQMTGDMLVNWPVYQSVITQARQMESEVYFYNFAYNGTFTITYQWDESRRYGVCHGDEVNYLFPVLNGMFEDLLLRNTENDNAMINILTEMWANFAKSGIPSARWSPEWEPYNDGQGYMEFGPWAEMSMQKDFLQDRMVFWYNMTEKQFPEELRDPNKPGNAATSTLDHIMFILLSIFLVCQWSC